MLLRRWVVTRYVLSFVFLGPFGMGTIGSDAGQTILDCSEVNEGFYVKCGFKRAGLEMAHYY
jgi:hypothetical protein